MPAVVDALSDRRYDLLHLSSPGPVGLMAALTGRLLGLPAAGAYHTELAAYAALRNEVEPTSVAIEPQTINQRVAEVDLFLHFVVIQ